MRRILLTTTSFPRTQSDWQGVFIREMLAALSRSNDTRMTYWGPHGPLPDLVETMSSEADVQFLQRLTDTGGIAHLLRSNPLSGGMAGLSLLRRLRQALQRNRHSHDLFHLNWLQSALAIPGNGNRALLTILGTDYKLLELPGVTALLRWRLARNSVVLAANAQWMVPKLETAFGDVAHQVTYVPFGIDKAFYQVTPQPAPVTRRWLTVLRLTRAKLGPLLDWTKNIASDTDEFHLIGPMQDDITLPPWIHYHGPATPQQLLQEWYPGASAMITLSQHDEGRPQVLLEAMASSLPVIASRIPAHADLLQSTQGGLLIENEADFCAAIKTLSDTRAQRALGATARNAISRLYGTWDDCAERYQALYSKLLEEVNP
ncbi:MAG: glycosyltransferase involved in cell wall biosynthesis [Gammaproteobacteria bacterium]|jgi:glycosyltransferase involved in cell wall biosynthesis